jgi:hypothetical protein
MKDALDLAFLRWLGFVVKFRFPDLAYRAAMLTHFSHENADRPPRRWHALLALDFRGQHPQDRAHAAFAVADADEPVRIYPLARAARSSTRNEKPLTKAKIGGWK